MAGGLGTLVLKPVRFGWVVFLVDRVFRLRPGAVNLGLG